MAAAAGPEPASGFAPLRIRDFRLLFAGFVISSALMPLQFITQIFWVQEHVSPDARIVLVGLIGSMRGAGALTFGLYGGALADRFDRRKLLIVTQSVAIAVNLAVAGLMLVSDGGPASLAVFFALTFVASGAFAVDAPTRQSMVPEVLGPRLTPAGISLNTAGAQVSMPVALFASGQLIDRLGFSATYALSGFGLLCEVLALLAMRHRSQRARAEAAPYGPRRTLADVREGIRYTVENRTVLWIIVLMVATMALGYPAVANLGPTWITTVVGVPFRNFGFVALTWGVGAFLASAVLTRFALFERKGVLLGLGTLGFGLAFVVFAMGTVPTAVIGNLALGISLATSQVSAATLIQHMVANEVRGRVMSLLQLNMGIAQLMTLPLAGIAQVTSLELLFPVLAFTVLGIVAVIVVSRPQLWSARVAVSRGPVAVR